MSAVLTIGEHRTPQSPLMRETYITQSPVVTSKHITTLQRLLRTHIGSGYYNIVGANRLEGGCVFATIKFIFSMDDAEKKSFERVVHEQWPAATLDFVMAGEYQTVGISMRRTKSPEASVMSEKKEREMLQFFMEC